MANTKKVRALDTELAPGEYIDVTILGELYKIRKKFKRLKFLRRLTTDPMSALELIFDADELARLEDQEMTEEEMSEVFDAVSEAMVGGPKG